MKQIKNIIFGTSLALVITSIVGCSLKKENYDSEINTKDKFEKSIDEDKALPKINEGYRNEYSHPTIIPSSLTPTLPPITLEESKEIIEEADIDDNRTLVALTFDDGPSKHTEDLLEVLNDNGVKATFFVLGCYCDNYPNALALMSDTGHEIAIHGDTHTAFTELDTEQVNDEITNTINYIESLGLDCSKLVRPPYGSLNSILKENIEYPFILWNIDTEDWKTKNKEQIKTEILDNITAGSIILMHDTKAVHEVDIEVLKELLPQLTKEYRFVTISELCDNYNINLENGKVYRKITSK